MSIDVNPGAIATPEVQAVLDLFDRLSDEAKRDTLARLAGRVAAPAVDPDDLDWGEITGEHHDLLAADAFAEMEREEEEFARGVRRRPG